MQLGKVVPGGRGPTDTSQPTAGNALTFNQDNPASETVLMNWDAENTTQLTFYTYAEISSSCEPHVGLLKALWSNDSLTWQHMWNRTTAQMARNQYEPARIALPPGSRRAPIGFKWVYSTTSQCSSSWATLYMDDITFPTVPPSADTAMIGKAPKAPLPSPSVCSALTAFCKAPGGPVSATPAVPAEGGRRLKSVAWPQA